MREEKGNNARNPLYSTNINCREGKIGQEFKEAIEKLDQELAYRDAVIDSILEDILVFDFAGKLVLHNPAVSKISKRYGLYLPLNGKVEDFASNFELLTSDGEVASYDVWPISRALRGERVSKAEFEVRSKRVSRAFWYSINANPVRKKNGEVLGCVVAMRDITQQKRTEKALYESERQFRKLADSMPHMIWVMDPNGFIQFLNKRWYEFTGLPPGDAEDKDWTRIIHPDDLAPAVKAWVDCKKKGTNFQSEQRLRKQMTDHFEWFQARAWPVLNDKGEIFKWCGTLTNIQHHKMIEASLRKADKEKDNFFAMLSHELRTPLGIIMGYAGLLQQEGPGCDLFNDALEAILRNVKAQEQLISDLLETSRAIKGKLTLSPSMFEPNKLIAEVVESIRSAALEKAIALQVRHRPSLEPQPGDMNRIRQILVNLLSNALKFTPAGGKVCLEVGLIGDWLEFKVTDTGIGIPVELLSRVFDRFWREDSSKSRQFPGVGLGLWIVRHLTELHGGYVWAESAGRDKGATFTVRFPTQPLADHIALRVEKSNAGIDLLLKPLLGKRLLVVDDQRDNVKMLESVLVRAGAQVDVAYSGIEALKEAKKMQFDGIISDISMPEMDGIEFLRKLQTWQVEHNLKITPALALSAYSEEGDQKEALAAGFQLHLAKPILPHRLLECVWGILDA